MWHGVNLLVAGRFEWKFRKITFNLNLLLDGWSILYQITLKYMLLDLTDPNWTKYSQKNTP